MSAKYDEEAIILEANDNDVLLGRGNAVNFREGNVRFRKLAQTKALRYATCSNKLEKDRIAASILNEIKSMGGRFLRPISAKNDKGEHLSAWEHVEEETAMTKAKQTLRDCAAAIRKETAMRSNPASPRSYDPTSLFQSTGTVNRLGTGTTNFLRSSPTSSQDSSAIAMSLQRSMMETASSSMIDAFRNPNTARSLSELLPHGLHNGQLLGDQQQILLLQAIQHQNLLAGLETSSRGRFAISDHASFHQGHAATSMSDVQRARETLLIEQYQREQVIAAAQQRAIWNQLSEQARARFDASFLIPSSAAAINPGVVSLRNLLERQRLQNFHCLDDILALDSSSALSVPQETLHRLTKNTLSQQNEHPATSNGDKAASKPERKSSFSSKEGSSISSTGGTSHSSTSFRSSPPVTKKARTDVARQEEDS